MIVEEVDVGIEGGVGDDEPLNHRKQFRRMPIREELAQSPRPGPEESDRPYEHHGYG